MLLPQLKLTAEDLGLNRSLLGPCSRKIFITLSVVMHNSLRLKNNID